MRNKTFLAICAISFILSVSDAIAAPALAVLGRDYEFPNKISGLPAKLSDFKDLEIKFFNTSDGVRLSYWEAGKGKPLIFVPAWSANGAEYVNVLFLLSKQYHVYVLDPRNQGLSQNIDSGMRISRLSMDLKEFTDHIGVKSADYCGWSMGASVLWSYIDLFGINGVRKVIFVDEPPSILTRPGWTEQERLNAAAMADSPQQVLNALTSGAPHPLVERFNAMDSPYYENSKSFARLFIKSDMKYMSLIMYDHASNDWRDVISKKIKVPTAIFTGEYSSYNLPSQRWMASVIPNARLYVYTKEEQGDHFLMFKNPFKFTQDLREFLER
ncbi:hydrolase or acyltransferase, alpha/beta fold family [Citrifermentans bemidjiense Bem]|uniref:Hydrolase or acyltransferase, alpha/beta fold family n=1 Tax=Citrifermentans bemidjiense (strain ATCC BAA-1014 / DSM 16622 / JCM 12645 / Bem) TaxID=404380 RepID=B5EBK2_CITBB|nr:alpha/beta hydrolase [Citrifermentans bemidjiense]ACH37471.1 hydrolase or acyltransferase, alpha/beta fold family [Citrifermentans bemidjiense Bem]